MDGRILLALVAGGCAAQPLHAQPGPTEVGAPEATRVTTVAPDAWSEKVAAAARWHLRSGKTGGRRDCSGLVNAILARAGKTTTGNSKTHWQQAEDDGRVVESPFPGALAVFDYTYDANSNGRVDDVLTHIGVVVEVGPGDTVGIVHYGSGRVKVLPMNLRYPSVHRRNGAVVNGYLRSLSYGPEDGPRLAGQLFRGYFRPPK